jgi:hypothetical protein
MRILNKVEFNFPYDYLVGEGVLHGQREIDMVPAP